MYAPLSETTYTGNLTLEELNVEEVKTLIPAIIYTCVLMTCGVLGNAVVIYVYSYRFKASNHRYFILTLGVCDFITSAICMPFLIVDMLRPFTFTNVLVCKSLRYVTYNTALVSIFTLCFIAIERYRKICRPFEKQVTLPLARRILLLIVFLTVTVFALPSGILYGQSSLPTGKGNITGVACFIDDHFRDTPLPAAYNLTLLVIVFFLGSAMVYCYIKIAYQRLLRAKARQARKKYLTVNNSDNYISSDHNGYEVPTSAIDGLKEEYINVSDKLNKYANSCNSQHPIEQLSRKVVETDTELVKIISEEGSDKTELSSDGYSYTTVKTNNEDISSISHIDNTNHVGKYLHVKSLDQALDSTTLYKNGRNLTTILSGAWHKRLRMCLSCHEGIDTSMHRFVGHIKDNIGTPHNAIKLSCSDKHFPSINDISNNCLSKLVFTKTKSLSAYNVRDINILTESRMFVKGKATSCDTLCIDSRSSNQTDSLFMPEKKSSENTTKYYTHANNEIIKTEKENGFLTEAESYNNIKQSHAEDLPHSIGFCAWQKCDIERDQHGNDTKQFNRNINKNKKGKQNMRSKKGFIKRSFTKSARFTESRDASVIRVTKMLFVISIVYFLSFIPHLVLMNIVLLDEHFLTSMNRFESMLYYIALRSFLINAVANPFIYNFMDRKFRKECRKICNRGKTA